GNGGDLPAQAGIVTQAGHALAAKEQLLEAVLDDRAGLRAVPVAAAQGRVPEAHGLVTAGRDQPVAAGAEGQAVDPVGVAVVGAQLPAGPGVPQLDRPLLVRTGEPFAVGVGGRARGLPPAGREAVNLLAGLPVPA